MSERQEKKKRYNLRKKNNEAYADDPNWIKQDDRSLEDRLNDFYDEHEWCGDNLDHFEIVYEIEPPTERR